MGLGLLVLLGVELSCFWGSWCVRSMSLLSRVQGVSIVVLEVRGLGSGDEGMVAWFNCWGSRLRL